MVSQAATGHINNLGQLVQLAEISDQTMSGSDGKADLTQPPCSTAPHITAPHRTAQHSTA
jgi:hypothetical protein